MGLTAAPPNVYIQGLAVTGLLVVLAVAALAPIRTGALHGSVTVVGKATTPSGYSAIVVLALAEEVFFRGFIAGLLFRRFGFRVANTLQALVFRQWRPCPLDATPLEEVSAWADGYRQFWDASYERLDQYLHELNPKEDQDGPDRR